eukprot:scaffold12895_cov164-Skeletonema_dohrnii-CCMP3373.AAC.2
MSFIQRLESRAKSLDKAELRLGSTAFDKKFNRQKRKKRSKFIDNEAKRSSSKRVRREELIADRQLDLEASNIDSLMTPHSCDSTIRKRAIGTLNAYYKDQYARRSKRKMKRRKVDTSSGYSFASGSENEEVDDDEEKEFVRGVNEEEEFGEEVDGEEVVKEEKEEEFEIESEDDLDKRNGDLASDSSDLHNEYDSDDSFLVREERDGEQIEVKQQQKKRRKVIVDEEDSSMSYLQMHSASLPHRPPDQPSHDGSSIHQPEERLTHSHRPVYGMQHHGQHMHYPYHQQPLLSPVPLSYIPQPPIPIVSNQHLSMCHFNLPPGSMPYAYPQISVDVSQLQPQAQLQPQLQYSQYDSKWLCQYNDFCAKLNNGSNFRRDEVGFKLYSWLSEQRRQRSRKSLAGWKSELLDKLGSW